MNIDIILPCFSEIFSHGSYVHFSALAEELQARGHDVVVRAGYASSFDVSRGLVAWGETRPCGEATVGKLKVVYYRHLRPFHPRCVALWFKSRFTVLADSWRMREVPRPIDIWRLQRLDSEQTDALARELHARAQAAGSSSALYSTYALGPHLPMRSMVRDAKQRGAVVLAGYFPFSTCPDAVHACNRAGVPVWVVPLFHALDVPHQNDALHGSARRADGVLALSPFNKEFFEKVVGCDNVHCMGSAPPAVSVARVENDGSDRDPYCVVFGRYHAGKNVGEAVRIVDAIRRDGVSNMGLKVIASAAPELEAYLPPYADVLSDISSEAAMQVLAGADALLFPSLHESFGIVCLEALRCGTPAIVKRSNHATRSVLEQYGLGAFLYDTESQAVDMLRSVHQGTLALPPDLAASEFTWSAVGQRVEQALRGRAPNAPA
jgi:glycosyltransferase involved in cell wall biosynthesis